MNIEQFRDFCLSLKGVSEEFPFDERTLVFKVRGKMFALADVDEFTGINLKCNPEKATELREHYQAVKPGYHMNKKHWNTILVESDMQDREIYEWIRHSYDLVVAGLSKTEKNELERLL